MQSQRTDRRRDVGGQAAILGIKLSLALAVVGLLALGLLAADTSYAAPQRSRQDPLQSCTTIVDSNIVTDTTWSAAGSPYCIRANITVNTGVTLSIDPGVTVMANYRELKISGHLEAAGSVAQPVIFTSEADSGPDQWSGLHFDGGTGRLQNTIVRYGGQINSAAVHSNITVRDVQSGEVRIENSQIRDSDDWGLYLSNGRVVLSDTLLTANGNDSASDGPLWVTGADSALTLTGNTFTGNSRDQVVLDKGAMMGHDTTLPYQDGLQGYHLGGDVFSIPAGITLTLEPGVQILKPVNVYSVGILQVLGHLQAVGTATQPITLTSVADSAPGQWSGLSFEGGTGHLRYVTVRYGNSNVQTLNVTSGEVRIENSQIRDCPGWGLSVNNSYVTINDSLFTANGSSASYGPLYIAGADSSVTLTNNSFTGNVRDRVVVAQGAMMGHDTTLTRQAVLEGYELIGNFTVPAGIVLTVEPGVTVMDNGGALYVSGHLDALGTATEPITFTSVADSAPGQWWGLYFNGGTGHLRHTTVRYSFHNIQAVNVTSGELRIENSQVRDCSQWGLSVNNSHVTINDSLFTANGSSASYGPLYIAGADSSVTLANNSFTGNVRDRVVVAQGAMMGHDTTLTRQAVLEGYELIGNFTVPAGIVLTVEPGVTVMDNGGALYVSGHLDALGTATQPITFTSVADSAPGQWWGLYFNGGTGHLRRTTVRHSFHNIQVVNVTGGEVRIENSQVRDCTDSGLTVTNGRVVVEDSLFTGVGDATNDYPFYITGASSEATLIGNTFTSNAGRLHVGAIGEAALVGNMIVDSQSDGLRIETSRAQLILNTIQGSAGNGLVVQNAQPSLIYNIIQGNGTLGLQNLTPATLVDAREQWWGDASGPYHATTNPAGLANGVSDGVLFDPWLQPPAFVWAEPVASLLHDVERLTWAVLGADPAAYTAEVQAAGAGQTYLLGSDLPGWADLTWDTTTVPDGRYELRATFYDVPSHVAGTATRDVLVNNSVVWHSGRIGASESWAGDRVHVVEGDLYVGSGATLTVEPGAVVKFAPGVDLVIDNGGVLNVPATASSPTVLTSLADDTAGGDTNWDGAQSLPRPGDWNGLTIQGSGVYSPTEYVELRYGMASHTGTLAGSVTWEGTFVHVISGDVTVPAGVTLTIEQGAIVKLGLGRSLIVNAGGTLLAQGTVAQPVVLTSIRDDTVGGDSNHDGNTTSPAPGDWYRLSVSGGTASLDHAQVRYGAGTHAASGALLYTEGTASLTVANSVLSDGFYTGLLAWGGIVDVSNSLLTGNDRGLSAHPSSTVNVVNSTVDDNRIGLLIHGGTLNVANTLATNSFECGMQYDYGTVGSLTYNDVWSPTGSNYCSMTDPTGTAGNVSIDPQYKNRTDGNYRLNYVSPVIDAADGGLAPATDHMGAPRYDDPRTPNTGTPTPGAAYADLGAYEFVETATSNIDLVVKGVDGPLSATSGEMVAVAWTVVNYGVEAAVGPWHDRVELVHSPEATRTILLAGEVLVGQDVTLGPGQQFRASAVLRVPGGVEADYYWQVETNSRGDLFEGQNRANNVTHSKSAVTLAVPELVLDGAPLARRFAAVGEPHWFKVTQPRDVDVELFLESADGGNVVDLYAGRGYIPSWQTYDYRQTEDNTANPSTFLPAGADALVHPVATYYLLADPRSLAGSGYYTIGSRRLGFELTSVHPTEVGNVGDVTLELRGGQLEPNTDFNLIAPDASVITTPVVYSLDGTLVEVTFDLSGRPPGWYDVQVTGPAGTITLPDALEVVEGVPPRVWVTAIGPRYERVGARFNYQVLYGNSGNVDAPVTLLDFYVPQGFTLLDYGDSSTFPTHVETHAAHDVTWSAARLGPGASEQLNVCLQCTNTDPQVTFYGPATAVPYNRSASSSRANPSTTVSDEIITANTETLYAVTHLVGDDGAADISYEMQITDTVAPITPTLIYTDDGLYEIVYLEVTMPAAGVDAAGTEATGGTTAESKQVKFKFKVPKVDPGVVYEWYERGKAWLGIGTTTLQKKAERDFRKDLARCLEELGYIKDHQRNALDGLADGQWLGRIGIQAAKEVIGRTPLAIYYEAQLNVVQELLDKDPWFARLQLIGQGQAGNTDKWMRKDNQSFINMTPLYGGNNDPSAFFKNVISNDDVQRCLQRLCATKGKPSAPRCADANESENEVCKLQTNEAEAKTSCVASYDPNDKSGPQGAGPERFIAPWQGLGYGIAFENVITATAPAQTVVITDHLDGSKVDLSTFQLGAITFGGTQVTPPPGRTEFATLVDLRPARDLLVQIDAEVDPGTGLVAWRFSSLDPLTRALPEDPLAGFLPPNAAPPEGEGHVFYTLQQRPGLGTGAEIRNQATIVFDQNEPILTPEWWNTIDADPPTSSVDPLPATSPSAFSVSWAGSDTGSGVAYYDLYVSEDGGSFVPWQTHITRTQAIFTGQGGHSYSFYTVATDAVGHREVPPSVPDAETACDYASVYLPLVLRKQ